MSTTSLDIAALNRPAPSVGTLMFRVMLALLPGTAVQIWAFGIGTLINVLVAITAALILEALILHLRGRPLIMTLADGSIALAAWLLALALPPALPLPQVLIGVTALVLLGKHLYGGLGCNPFNPAMVGYAVLIVSFPITMTDWQPTVFAMWSPASLSASATDANVHVGADVDGDGTISSDMSWDGVSSATPLDRLRTVRRAAAPEPAIIDPARTILLSPWPWINGGFLLGGLWMLLRGVINWRIPLSLLGSLALLHLVHGGLAGTPQAPFWAELLAGSAMLGAFFIATDPVTAASGPRARLVYGAGIGVLTFVLREFSAYPEGIAFAVLLMNMTVPMLDRLSRPPSR